MFISIILNVEYMDYASRKMWYLKNLLHCKENGWILITHDYIRKHFDELQDSITDRFFEQFEMRRFTLDEVKDVEQYFIPDEIFDSLESNLGTRTAMISSLCSSAYKPLDDELDKIIKSIQAKHPEEKIDGIFHCLEGYESIRKLANNTQCPLISYSFAAFRKPHGYRQTLYQSSLNGHYWDADSCRNRYKKFIAEECCDVPVLSNKEIIALIGKERTLPLISLMAKEPKFEMGICCECYSLVPKVFQDTSFVDDDIFYECKTLYKPEQIKVRSHAAHLNDIQVNREEVHNDPASTILSCRRSTAVQSQIILKVLLWGRTAVMRKKTLPFAFMCTKDYKDVMIADIKELNYFIFGFLIPSNLMFSDEYWRWRMTNPSENEIYKKHLTYICDILSVDYNRLWALPEAERFKYILTTRGCDRQLLIQLCEEGFPYEIDWNVPYSRFDVKTKNGKKSYWRLDKKNEDGSLTTCLEIDASDIESIDFFPLDDMAGFTKIENVFINFQEQNMMTSQEYQYMPKVSGHYVFKVPNDIVGCLIISCTWRHKNVFDYLNKKTNDQ